MVRHVMETCKILGSAHLTSISSTVSEVSGVSMNLMGVQGVPLNAEIYQISLDDFEKLPKKKQRTLLEAGYDLRVCTLSSNAITAPAFYIVIWTTTEHGQEITHYAPLSEILTPEERFAHAAYACQLLNGMMGGSVYDEESLPDINDLIATHRKTRILDDGAHYHQVPVLAIPRMKIADMLHKGWRVHSINGTLYWTKKAG